ncbi:SH3-like domain-containing protein [Elusimicrobium posterum]|uniref:SH3 domain-containing protein n=1 Tax=Elusimicrobium posterum TaxID=3116653 RepID=UPI003C73820E
MADFEANVRSCPSYDCNIKWKAWQFTPLQIMQFNEDKTWAEIKDFEGHTGWILNSALSTDISGLSAKLDTNVYNSYDMQSGMKCTVEKGYTFKYLFQEEEGWLFVTDEPDDESEGPCTGWAHSSYLWGPAVKNLK